MIFRATVQDGLIVINTHGKIPDGTEVEVVRPQNGASRPSGVSKGRKKARTRPSQTTKPSRGAGRKSGQKAQEALRKVAGIWAARLEWKGKSSVEVSRELRAKSMRGMCG